MLEPVRIFATSTRGGATTCDGGDDDLLQPFVCFCYDRRENLLHPFMAEMRHGEVATVFIAIIVVFGYDRQGLLLHPLNGVD